MPPSKAFPCFAFPRFVSQGLQVPSKKVRSWGVFRRLSTFLEGIWSPRVCFYSDYFAPAKRSRRLKTKWFIMLLQSKNLGVCFWAQN